MLSSRFLVVSFLYIFYAARLVTADQYRQSGGDNQLCQSVQTVTVIKTVAPSQSPSPSNKGQPAAVNNPPGKVDLNGGGDNNTKNGTTNSSGNNGKTNSKGAKTDTKNGNVKTNSTSGNDNPATSLTLDPSVIQNINGKGQAAGETDSLVSTNNFINFCVGKTITNGKQVQGGSCNPTPMGDIPSVGQTPSAKFNSPKNFDTIASNTPFTVALQINNFDTGTFTNADNTYFAAPQQLVNGVIQGHSHVTIQQMTSLNSPTPLNPKIFAFFKGLNDVAQNDILTADVTKGLPAGVYRIACINSAGNHQEVLGPVAQRGSFNDAIYITVADGGNNTDTKNTGDTPSSTDSSSSSPPASSSTDNSGKGGKNNGKGDDVSSSAASPESTSPPSGNGQPDSKDQGTKNSDKGYPDDKSSDITNPDANGSDTKNQDTKSSDAQNPDANKPAVSSSASTPDSTPTQEANGKGDKWPQDNNYQYTKRMYKRSRNA